MNRQARFRYGNRCAEGISEVIELSDPAELTSLVLKPGAWFTLAFDPAAAVWPGFGRIRVFYPEREYGAEELAPQPAPVAGMGDAQKPDDAWTNTAARAIACITQGEAEKIVLARKITVTHGAFDPLENLNQAAAREKGAQPWLIDWGEGECWWGLSPELLLDWKAGQARSMALAGTRRRGETPGEDEALARELMQSEKDQREQGIVTQWIEERFRECGLQPQRSERSLHRLSALQHLLSWVSASATRDQALELLTTLHPSPALLGSPRENSLAWLRANESLSRGLYGGIVGCLSDTGFSAHVMIRGVRTRDRVSELYAGTGLVRGSRPDEEWQEGEAKLAAIYKLLVKGADS